jgi:hypothetical protein
MEGLMEQIKERDKPRYIEAGRPKKKKTGRVIMPAKSVEFVQSLIRDACLSATGLIGELKEARIQLNNLYNELESYLEKEHVDRTKNKNGT